MLLAAAATAAACATGKGSDNQQASLAESTNTAATNSATDNNAGPLASWNDGPAKQAILDFVRITTDIV